VTGMREMLRALQVFPDTLPEFKVESAPDDPVTLFLAWLAEAVADGILGPHVMTLATADAAGQVSSRVLICKDVDEAGRWYFASDASSGKGRDLAVNPHAAASFYWPQHGRQVRISGQAAAMGDQAGAADFLARPPAGRAAALIGRQSEPLDDPAELDEAFHRAEAAIDADPGLVSADWTLFGLSAKAVEFWQADHERRHIRLQYVRTDDAWTSGMLWP
jgi:pyridoxamine 5'-phosphate oxidase